MKLLQKSQQLFLRIALPLFVAAGFVLYYALQLASNVHTDRRLRDVRTEIELFVWHYDRLPGFFESVNDRLYVEPLPPGIWLFRENFSDTTLYNPIQKKLQPFRLIHFPLQMRGQVWRATLMQSTIERRALAVTVALVLAGMFVVLFWALAYVNRSVSRQVWTPFFATLQQMRQFRLRDNKKLDLDPSDVQEFRELNNTLDTLTQQLRQDFNNIRRFTENASHELQTPLAVIEHKVESLLQDESLSESQIQQISVIGQSTRRMARLNQSLLLLSKIENSQFAERSPVELKPLIEKRLLWLEDFITEKSIVVESELEDIVLTINPFLVDTLLSNLLGNAVKHCTPGGTIRLSLQLDRLRVENDAEPPTLPLAELSERFTRGNPKSEGVGLGLAIVREICQQMHLQLHTAYHNGKWTSEVVLKDATRT